MIDLRGIARRLRLSVDQIRLAADLLEQGYQPAFIQRYRADESGGLPKSVLWSLKLDIDRQQRISKAREKAKSQLPKEAELDEEAQKFLESATTETEIEVAMRCWRARRNLQQSQERDKQPGQLLEKLISFSGSAPENIDTWAAEQLGVDTEEAAQVVQSTKRLVGSLLQGDTSFSEKLRRTIQKKAQLEVEYCEGQIANDHDAKHEDKKAPADSSHATAPKDALSSDAIDETTSGDADSPVATETVESSQHSTASALSASDAASIAVSEPAAVEASADATAGDGSEDASAEPPSQIVEAEQIPSAATTDELAESIPEKVAVEKEAAQKEATETKAASDASKDEAKTKQSKNEKKNVAKLTPRQRRRRWLAGMLQPLKSLKRNVTKLTAYQQLMLGRGRRSQLVNTHLRYDANQLISMGRDTFVNDKHPLVAWFESASKEALDVSIRAKVEADALGQLEEQAQEKLLETAADQLRHSLMRRPIRGHVIMVVDTVGPKTSSVAVTGPDGSVLHTDEVTCSANPDIVNQNLVRLGEIAHRFKVSLVALTNGPARRFLVLTIRELVNQSVASGLRWTMADRGGADAYAAGKVALRELPSHNRRDRAAIWVGRSMQNPMEELLKVDINRLRLGSYQRELPQEPLKQLIRETIADCVSCRGIDILHANIEGLKFISGLESEQAQQIATFASNGQIRSREQLLADVTNWPEKQARQAIGFLRLFGADESLDATLIHPDDYKLAERLIANTDLESPPNAPPGWQAPATESTVEQPAPESTETTTIVSESTTIESDPANASDETVNAEPALQAESEPEISPTQEPTPAADVTVDQSNSPTSEADESESSEIEPVSTVDTDPIENSSAQDSPNEVAETNEASQPDSTADEATSADAELKPSAKPEYSEDVLASRKQKKSDDANLLDIEKHARGWQVGREKLRRIASCLADPFFDPRLNETPIPMLAEIPSLSSLKPEMCLWAVVVGVADFGAFVEIAPDCSGLVHISRLSANFVEDPHQIVQIGDLIMVWVVSVDEQKNRVALTALSPKQRAKAEASSNAQGARRRNESRSGSDRGKGRAGGKEGGRHSPAGQSRDGGGKSRRPSSKGQSRGRQGGRRDEPRVTKPVVVKSKKPKKKISEAMKEGDEPLRSFSDLVQFYEAKRTDVPPPKSADEANKPAAESETASTSTNSTDASEETQAESQND